MIDHDFPIVELTSEQFKIKAFKLPQPEGWEAPINFPNCCTFHKSIVQFTKEFLVNFPYCCEGHREFSKRFPIKKGEYDYLINEVVFSLNYTEYIIEKKINDDDWFENITDYIEYVVKSYGHPAIGCHLYLSNVLHYLENTSADLIPSRKERLIDFLKNPPKKNENSPNLKEINRIYKKWLSVFPFELSFFSPLKNHFYTTKPFVSKIIKTNVYTGETTFSIHNNESMVELLFNITKKILSSIDTNALVKDGIINDFERHSIDLIFKQHNLRTTSILESYNKKERQYLKTINDWLGSEIKFFKDIKSYKSIVSPIPKKKKPEKKDEKFGPRYIKHDSIKNILFELHREIEIVDEEHCSIHDLIDVFLDKEPTHSKKIHLKCYNNQFAFIINQFKYHKFFKNLNPATIGRSKKFISKEGTNFSAQLFYSSKNQNKFSKEEDTISSIFKKY
jgi:hypothetical protein